jgi:hypothetical protein
LLAPDEEPHSLRHDLPDAQKELLCQPLEAQFRSFINVEIERIKFIDDRRDVGNDGHLDGWSGCGRGEFLPGLSPRCAIQRAVHVIIKIGVFDVEPRHRHARYADKTPCEEAPQRLPVAGRKLLEHDEPGVQCARVPDDRKGQQPRSGPLR